MSILGIQIFCWREQLGQVFSRTCTHEALSEGITLLGDETLQKLDRDVRRIFEAKISPAVGYRLTYDRTEAMQHVLARLLGPNPGASRYTQIAVALEQTANRIEPQVQRDAARIMLGLDDAPGENYSQRINKVVELYRATGQPRQSRRVIARDEIPQLRKAVVHGLALLHAEYSRSRRLDPDRRERAVDQFCKVSWDMYERYVSQLAHILEPLVRPDPDDWAMLGITRGGLPLAVHLSHLLGVLDFGTVSVWKPPLGAGAEHVSDGLFGPIRGLDWKPSNFLLVEDVVTAGKSIATIAAQLHRHYGQDGRGIRVWEISLFRDVARSPSENRCLHCVDFDSAQTWWVLPWETGMDPHPAEPTTASP